MIAEIRAFIRETVLSIDSDYRENERNNQDAGEIYGDKNYHLAVGDASPVSDDTDNITAKFRLIFKGGTDKLADFDEAYCEALLIKRKILDIALLNNKQYIKIIKATNYDVSELTDGLDLYIFELNLNILIGYGLEV